VSGSRALDGRLAPVRRTALVVDDSAAMRRRVSAALALLSIDAVEAGDGAEAWRRLQGGAAFDLILTDINMPLMDGLKLVGLVRSGGAHRRTPILVITTESAQEDRRRAQSLGANGYLVKPVDGEAIAEAVRQVLRLRTEERIALLGARLETNRLYRGGLLVQSEAATESTMSQYRVGRVTFASVLEVLNGYVADRSSYLLSMAEAQRVAISQWELSLDPPAGASAAMAGGPVPGAGAMGRSSSGSSPRAAAEAAAPPAAGGSGM